MATAPQAATDMTQIAAAFLNIRNARSAIKRDYETKDDELKATQAKLEAVMLGHLNTHGMESVRTEAGTFYRQEEVKPSCADWDALNRWIVETNGFDAYERRLKKTFITEYMADNDGAMPPGVSVHREYVVRVRRANS